MNKTIKQIADEIGVSKTAVRKKLTDEVKTKFAETVSGTIFITPEGVNVIKSRFSSNSAQTRFSGDSANKLPPVSSEVSTVISMLQQELESKNKLIERQQQSIQELTAALENTTSSLHAAQALHAGTMHHQIETSKVEKEETLEDLFRSVTQPKKKRFFDFLKKKR